MGTTPYYEDDTVTLWHEDALAVLLGMPGDSVEAVITDPPYSSGGQFRSDRTNSTYTKYLRGEQQLHDFGGDNRDQRGYAYWSALWLTQCYRVAVPGAVLAVATDWRQLPVTTDAVQAGGWTWRGIASWAKPNARPMLGRYRQACEFVVWATKGSRTIEGECLNGWWLVDAPRDRQHQTQKPLEVYRDLVRVAPKGGLVLDPFMGSGTTGVACLMEGRRFVGVEMSADYVEVAKRRLASVVGRDEQQQPALFEAAG